MRALSLTAINSPEYRGRRVPFHPKNQDLNSLMDQQQEIIRDIDVQSVMTRTA